MIVATVLFKLNKNINQNAVHDFDTNYICQILAAVYAYLPSSRYIMDNSPESIFEIVVALAKKYVQLIVCYNGIFFN